MFIQSVFYRFGKSNKDFTLCSLNRVIHGYDKIDNEIVWGTIVRHLPVLKSEIENLLE
ncbi:MAG: DUF86 domain-containing protein [Prolixibacteraceae bacterium]|nr:DUF86 domain-containing protein [Prolixibacteraceae bacterium]